MLEVAKQKVSFAEFHEGYAQKLPFEDGLFDFLSISYGFRNVTEKEEAVREFARVLKSGGRLLILEFAKNESKNPLRKAAQWYVKKVLPWLGGIISGNLSAYRYLPNSIEGFLTRGEIVAMLERNGFEAEVAKDFSFGVSSLVIAKKKMTPVKVGELNRQIKGLLESHFTYLSVEGEISNLTVHTSGHIYFSLKDDEGKSYQAEAILPSASELFST
jgi:SAM-dependent methyltransferase